MKLHLISPPRCLALAAVLLLGRGAAPAADTNAPAWLTQPMSINDALKLALMQNGTLLKSESELEAAHGIAVQTRAITLPTVRASASYLHTEAVEDSPYGNAHQPRNQWVGGLRVVQSIYEGGRLRSARRTATLTREQALLRYQTVVADTILGVRAAYYDALLAEQQITVQEASLKLLDEQLNNTKKRFDAGAVPRFDLLRAEVEIANARPRLIRARNAHRTARNDLAVLLGYDIPATVMEDIPMTLTDRLEASPYLPDLPAALARAIAVRPELGALRKEEALRQEAVNVAKATGKPSLGVFAGYAGNNSQFRDDFSRAVSGPIAGLELHWDLWDGHLTQGKVTEARALLRRAGADLDDQVRKVEREVRTAHSSLIEAREVLDAQAKVLEQADEALRLAGSRYEAGTGTQLDVLNAQTSLTEARSIQAQALHDYALALARLERAVGPDVIAGSARARDKAPAKP
jgi:TolC family type I secretion outer membrane protein